MQAALKYLAGHILPAGHRFPPLVYNNDRLLPFCPTPTYLGVKLDRSLMFADHTFLELH